MPERRAGAVSTWPTLRSRARRGRGRHHADQPEHPRPVRGGHRRDRRRRPRGRRACSTTTAPTSTPSSASSGPGDMGFDIVHMNLHKTFATPHGGGGPGAGPVAVSEAPGADFLPGPRPVRLGRTASFGLGDARRGPSAGCTPGTATPWSWPGPWPTSWSTGATACSRVAETAVLNANWIRRAAARRRTTCPSTGPCMHEVVLSDQDAQAGQPGCGPSTSAKRLLEKGFHSPTVYFPLIVRRGADDRAHRDREPPDGGRPGLGTGRNSGESPEALALAPRTTPIGRADEARAARSLVPTWDASGRKPRREIGSRAQARGRSRGLALNVVRARLN